MANHLSSFSPEQTNAVVDAARSRDTGGLAVIATDAAGTIVYWNDQAASLYGWEPDEAIGRNVLDVTPTRNSTDNATQIMEELRLGQEWTGEFIVKHRDGTPMMAHVSNFLVRERQNVIGVVGISKPASRKGPPGAPKRTIAD